MLINEQGRIIREVADATIIKNSLAQLTCRTPEALHCAENVLAASLASERNKLVVVLLSGGLDSSTLAYLLSWAGYTVSGLNIDYGQRHRRELTSAIKVAALVPATLRYLDLSNLRPFLAGSALTDSRIEVPEGHYEAESMRATVVPNRNAILLSIAFGHALSLGGQTVAMAAHAGDHAIYPDCRPEFVLSFEEMMAEAVELGTVPVVLAPFLALKKHHIADLALALGVPVAETWSCYKGGAVHCGKCGTCTERREAFELIGVQDPTEYDL